MIQFMNNEPAHFESLYPDNTRENEISKILSFIKEGNSCQIISLPGGGRSNLLGLLTYNQGVRIKHLGENQKWFHFVLSNFAEVRKRSLFDVTKFLFLNLIDSIHARHSGLSRISLHHEESERDSGVSRHGRDPQNDDGKAIGSDDIKTLKEIFNESIVSNDELVLLHGLKRAIDLLSIEKELTVVFLFDRFEDYIPSASQEFFTNLRVLRDRAKYRFSVVFSLHKPLEDLIGEDILLDFYQFVAGHTVYLSLFDKIGIDFRISYMEKVGGKTLEKEIIDAILDQTSGHANLTRLAVETVIDSTDVIPNLFRDLGPDSKKMLKQVQHDKGKELSNFLLEQKSMKAALLDIWKSLTPSEQNILSHRHSGEEERRLQNLPASFMAQRDSGRAHSSLARMTTGFDESHIYLENVGLIKNGKITIPLFAEFVKHFNKESSNIIFDPNTNEVKKGYIMLSDSLTSSEYKLLRFLLQNSSKIIEREEIIKSVWADTKSTAGVTDQALDQLIFRVRRKIEDDPISPLHLLTVKGRGFRFTP